jgi:hypothetical protein
VKDKDQEDLWQRNQLQGTKLCTPSQEQDHTVPKQGDHEEDVHFCG